MQTHRCLGTKKSETVIPRLETANHVNIYLQALKISEDMLGCSLKGDGSDFSLSGCFRTQKN